MIALAPRAVAAARSLLGIVILSATFATTSPAAPSAQTWERWTRHDSASQLRVDHTAWTTLLAAHVVPGADGINRLRYAAIAGEARALLDDYLGTLQRVPISTARRDEQRAFWINLYNALTVHIVVSHYPVTSIRDIDISPGLFADGPWGLKQVNVEGEELSLDDIEHRILRPIWKDPRIHYAVNCASLGCPNLLREAFTAGNTERLLDDGAHAYVNHPRGANVSAGQLTVSSIYAWFEDDFGGNDAGVIEHLRRYADDPLLSALEAVTRIHGDAYDWSLNDTR